LRTICLFGWDIGKNTGGKVVKKYDVLIIGGGPAAITIAKILGKVKSVGVIFSGRSKVSA